jgi:hypothetical protein
MAIVQISRITHRKGLQENLPQLAGAELGWSIDERRLYIGNGTLEEGAPVIGNTEILTEFSDILEFQTTYTYKGEAAGYTVQTGPTANDPVSQSLQSWLDQFATVKDFGATGDGITDDTAAINRALNQLYCRETNPQIRRSLFFPAGVYKISQTIIIPPYATLVGEGADNSIIQLDSGDDSALRAYVARTGDSLQQTGVNIGNNGAIAPQYVTVSNLKFQSLDPDSSIFYVEDATNCSFQRVTFQGPLTTADLDTATDNTSGVIFASTPALICTNIVFDQCKFSGTTYGAYADVDVKQINFTNSEFNTLYQGIVLGETNGGPTGVKVLHNLFDNIYAQGVLVADATLCATGYNYFLDVGNHFNGLTSPATAIVEFETSNNISLADMFARADQYATTYQRVEINDTQSIATINGFQTQEGTLIRQSGLIQTLVNNTSVPDILESKPWESFAFNYKIVRDLTFRSGTITIANAGSGALSWNDDYVQNASTGVSLTVTESAGTVSINYTTTNTGIDGTISYSFSRFD